MLDHEDLVRAANGRKPVGDDDRRPSVQQPVERALDQDLGGAVDVRRRLVEDQDARVGEQCARDRDQLALAGRQARAALAHGVREPGVEAARDPVDAHCVRDVGDHLVGRLGAREADVVADRPGEEERILQHHSQLAAVRAQLELAQVVPVHADRAVVRVVEAADELGGRGLAAAGLADEREAAARGDVDVDRVQHRLFPVREGDAVDVQVTVDALGATRAGPVRDLRLACRARW